MMLVKCYFQWSEYGMPQINKAFDGHLWQTPKQAEESW